MHKRINAQIGHCEGYQDRPDKSPGPNQAFESGSLARIQSIESAIKILPVVTHQRHAGPVNLENSSRSAGPKTYAPKHSSVPYLYRLVQRLIDAGDRIVMIAQRKIKGLCAPDESRYGADGCPAIDVTHPHF